MSLEILKKFLSNPSLEGKHQIENASTAITTAMLLKKIITL